MNNLFSISLLYQIGVFKFVSNEILTSLIKNRTLNYSPCIGDVDKK